MAAGEAKMSIDSMSLEHFCMAPRTLQEIIDKFSGMKSAMDELDAFQRHVRKMKDICYHSLHQTYYNAFVDLKNRRSNANFTGNAKRRKKIDLLMNQLLSKASELLSRHLDSNVVTTFKNIFSDMFNQRPELKNKMFSKKNGKPVVDPELLLSDGMFKEQWVFLRFYKKGTNAPQGEAKTKLKKLLVSYQAQSSKRFTIPHNSACVLEAYHAEQKLLQRREYLTSDYKKRAKQIIPTVLDYVRRGILEVCNEYQTSTPESRFLFATRRVTQPIRQTTNNKEIPRGTMVGTQGQLQLRDQETNVRFDINTNREIVINQTLRNGQTTLTMHGIGVELNLCELVPYLTPTRPMPVYKNNKHYMDNQTFTDLLAQSQGVRKRKRTDTGASAGTDQRARIVTNILTQ